jgi:hypothetical protein
VWRDRGGAAVAGRGRVGQFRAPPGPAGAGEAVRGAFGGGDGACGSNASEREAGERKGGAGYYTRLCSSGPTHQPMNISR